MFDNGIPQKTYHLHGKERVITGMCKDGNPVVVAFYGDGSVLAMTPDGEEPSRIAMITNGGKTTVGIPVRISPYGGRKAGNPNTTVVLTPIGEYYGHYLIE